MNVQDEMSILEKKIRKKIMLVSGDGRSVLKKLRNMHILKRIISDPNAHVRGHGQGHGDN